jgi:glycosyltransferase involved in cell wall biosynthesis
MRLAVICDYLEENWPSMDLAAEMLQREVQESPSLVESAWTVRPPFRRRVSLLPGVRKTRAAFNADRLLNRFWDYPRFLRGRLREWCVYHVCDHSYAQLVHVLPAERTGVYCHDLDAFRCLLDPQQERRPLWFRLMARRTLSGLQKAAVVFYSTQEIGEQIRRRALVDASRLVHAPLGVCPEFRPPSPVGRRGFPPEAGGRPYLLHVGSCIPRKRIDVLLEVYAAVRKRRPDVSLIQVGGTWTDSQRRQLARHDLEGCVRQLRGLDRRRLAEFYQGAAVVLQPSEAEGFGLPAAEALACGAAVIASDLPVLREVGGAAVLYRTVADVPAWTEAVCRLLDDPSTAPSLAVRQEQVGRYSWRAHAETIASTYRDLLSH